MLDEARTGSITGLLLVVALAPWAIALLVALGLWVWSLVRLKDPFLKRETRALFLIAVAPLPILVLAPGLLLTHPLVTLVSVVVLLVVASVVFRHTLRLIQGEG